MNLDFKLKISTEIETTIILLLVLLHFSDQLGVKACKKTDASKKITQTNLNNIQ